MFPAAILAVATALVATATGAEETHRHGAPAAVERRIEIPDVDSGPELLGTRAPDWRFTRWVRGGPLRLEALRGKVVLLRWWTEGCHFCATTLPALEDLRGRQDDDLVVIGVFHPKPRRPVSDRHVLGVARRLGWKGPIALDQRWETLERYWFEGHPERNWTSVSFLIDREGVIRWVHGGGEYHPGTDPAHARCDLQYRELEQALAGLRAADAGTDP